MEKSINNQLFCGDKINNAFIHFADNQTCFNESKIIHPALDHILLIWKINSLLTFLSNWERNFQAGINKKISSLIQQQSIYKNISASSVKLDEYL